MSFGQMREVELRQAMQRRARKNATRGQFLERDFLLPRIVARIEPYVVPPFNAWWIAEIIAAQACTPYLKQGKPPRNPDFYEPVLNGYLSLFPLVPHAGLMLLSQARDMGLVYANAELSMKFFRDMLDHFRRAEIEDVRLDLIAVCDSLFFDELADLPEPFIHVFGVVVTMKLIREMLDLSNLRGTSHVPMPKMFTDAFDLIEAASGNPNLLAGRVVNGRLVDLAVAFCIVSHLQALSLPVSDSALRLARDLGLNRLREWYELLESPGLRAADMRPLISDPGIFTGRSLGEIKLLLSEWRLWNAKRQPVKLAAFANVGNGCGDYEAWLELKQEERERVKRLQKQREDEVRARHAADRPVAAVEVLTDAASEMDCTRVFLPAAVVEGTFEAEPQPAAPSGPVACILGERLHEKLDLTGLVPGNLNEGSVKILLLHGFLRVGSRGGFIGAARISEVNLHRSCRSKFRTDGIQSREVSRALAYLMKTGVVEKAAASESYFVVPSVPDDPAGAAIWSRAMEVKRSCQK